MVITDQADADQYFNNLVQAMMAELNLKQDEAESIVRYNIGYYANYYSVEKRERAYELYKTNYPIFPNL